MNKCLLDTSTCSLLMEDAANVKGRLYSLAFSDYPFTVPIVRGEILFGIIRLPSGRRRQDLEQKADELFSEIPCDPIPFDAGDAYAQMKLAAQRQGTPLDQNDLWIAASAIALDAILVTADSDFQRVQGLFGLRLENWTN